MSKSIVYYTNARATKWDYKYSLNARLEAIIKRLDFSQHMAPDDYVAVKMHFGSEGAYRIVRPVFVRKIVDGVKAVGAKPFVTDTTRIQGWDYLEIANQNGINPQSMGAPVILADGLFGYDGLMVDAGPVLGQVFVASAIHDTPAMVVVSHCKGHIQAGYGGAIKNIAMGGVSSRNRHGGWKQARGHLHAASESTITRDKDKCVLCMQCLHVCPLEAITYDEAANELVWDDDTCWRCMRCARVCPEEAIAVGRTRQEFQAGLAEAAGAVLRTFEPGKVLYFNFVTEVQPECDCMPVADTPLVQDQGILASTDIVAVEQATLDLINGAVPLPDSLAADKGLKPGARVLADSLDVDGQEHVDAAAALGLGSKEYELILVTEGD
ncbi:MAG: DUF362 domain-containing protein [Chloroflexi bacterium]|nr:DUF362 domain-containing protein [Chloroflexota bacterium]MBU1747363.1 DUF362 domain-containing protein [Chloroflexota bacterium]